MAAIEIFVLILILVLNVIFPVVATYIAFKKGRTGWAIATIVSTFLGLGLFLGIVAIMVSPRPPQPSESEGIVCPVCENDDIKIRNVVIDRKGGEPVTPWLQGVLGLLVGASFLVYPSWLVMGVVTKPFPSGANFNWLAILFPGFFGFVITMASVKELVRWKKADKVNMNQYKCRVCKYEWSDSGKSAENLPKNLSSNCVKCGESITGVLYDWNITRRDHRKSNMVGYRCKSCGSDFCVVCQEEHIKFKWFSGLEKTLCPKCNNPFGPGFYFYEY